MFSRNTERPPTNDGRPPAPPTTPPGVRDVSVPAAQPTPAQPTAASVPTDLTLIGRADRLEGTLKVADTLRIQGTLEGTVEATTVHIDEGRQGPRGHHRGRGHHRRRLQRQARLPAAPGDPGDRSGRRPCRDLPVDAPRRRLHRRRAQDAQAARGRPSKTPCGADRAGRRAIPDRDRTSPHSAPIDVGPVGTPPVQRPARRRCRGRGFRAHRLTRLDRRSPMVRPGTSRKRARRLSDSRTPAGLPAGVAISLTSAGLRATLREAVGAVDGLAAGGSEGDLRDLAAAGAGGLEHLARRTIGVAAAAAGAVSAATAGAVPPPPEE